ncbi:MAG: tetratricopeptide repeat protein [Candidatus Dadabacteria bacterium]|nr:tetratricopeptide repeat protein [Candidatus Dadabacteria bacterium]
MASLAFKAGSYYAVFSRGIKKKWLRIGRVDKKQAKKMLRQLELEYNKDRLNLSLPSNLTLDQYLEKYFEYTKTNKAISTYTIELEITKAIKRYFDDIELSKIDSLAVENYKTNRKNLGLKSATVNKELSVLRFMLNKAIELKPTFIEAYNQRGFTKLGLNDYKGTIDDLSEGIKDNSSNEKLYYYRGIAKSRIEDHIDAIQDFNKSIELNPKNYQPYSTRGNTKLTLGDKRGALEDFNKAIDLNPNHAYAYYNRGLVKIGLGEKNGGCLDLSKAGELGYAGAYESIKEYCN